MLSGDMVYGPIGVGESLPGLDIKQVKEQSPQVSSAWSEVLPNLGPLFGKVSRVLSRVWKPIRAVLSRYRVIVLILLVAFVLLERFNGLSYASSDYLVFGKAWYADLANGGFGELKQNFANYNVPYLYLLLLTTYAHTGGLAAVKIIAFVFDLIMSVGVFFIVRRFNKGHLVAVIAGVATLALPEVLLNSSWWGQADSTFSALIVWSIYFLIVRKNGWAWAFFGAALAFKLQAVFILPAMCILFIVYRHKFWTVLVGVGVFFSFDIPALLAGRSFSSLVSVYSSQVGQYPSLTLNAPNFYIWLQNGVLPGQQNTVWFIGYGIAFVSFAFLGIFLLFRARVGRTVTLWPLQVAAAFGVLVPYVLPEMHERYFYIGNVLLFVLAVFDRRYTLIALASQYVAVYTYSRFLVLPFPSVPGNFTELAWVELGVVVIACYLTLFPKHGSLLVGVKRLSEIQVGGARAKKSAASEPPFC